MRTIKAKFEPIYNFWSCTIKKHPFLDSLYFSIILVCKCNHRNKLRIGASEPNVTWLTEGRGVGEVDMNKYGKASKNVSCTRSKAKAIAHPVFPLREPQSDRGNFSESRPGFLQTMYNLYQWLRLYLGRLQRWLKNIASGWKCTIKYGNIAIHFLQLGRLH